MSDNVVDLKSGPEMDNYLLAQYAEWERLTSEVGSLNKMKQALLDNVEAKGVLRESFKTEIKRRAMDDEKQQKFDFGNKQCRDASEAVQRAAQG